MKRRAVYAMLVSFCICFFFSTARTNSNIGKKFNCGNATIQETPTPSSGDLEISIIYSVLLKI
jgi:hypothetical protein